MAHSCVYHARGRHVECWQYWHHTELIARAVMNAVETLITGHGRRRPRHRRHARWTVSATGLRELIANTGLIAPELITGKVHRCHVPLLTITKFDIREMTLILGGRPTELIPQFAIIPSSLGVLHWACFFFKTKFW